MFAWLAWWRPPFLHKRVVVNLISGGAIRGLLWETRGPWLTVRQAEGLAPGGAAEPIDGEVVIERRNVEFVQVLP